MRLGLLSVVLFIAIAGNPLLAQNLGVAPIRIDLSPSRPVAAVTFTNRGEQALFLEVDVAEWRQEDGTTMHAPTDRILANPAIFSLAPGGEQIVRVGLLALSESAVENAYRLIVRELVEQTAVAGATVRVRMQVTLPIFFATTDTQPEARIVPSPRSAGENVIVENTGTGHLRLFGLRDAANRFWPMTGYVLPGAWQAWRLEDIEHAVPPCQVNSNAGLLAVPCGR